MHKSLLGLIISMGFLYTQSVSAQVVHYQVTQGTKSPAKQTTTVSKSTKVVKKSAKKVACAKKRAPHRAQQLHCKGYHHYSHKHHHHTSHALTADYINRIAPDHD